MANGIFKVFTDSVDECRQAAFEIRKAFGNGLMDAFHQFDAALTRACEDFTTSYKATAQNGVENRD